jgi:hypothetical protein
MSLNISLCLSPFNELCPIYSFVFTPFALPLKSLTSLNFLSGDVGAQKLERKDAELREISAGIRRRGQ